LKRALFIDFIHFLEKKKIQYVILGNSETYPENIGSDVDIAIDKDSFNNINSLIKDFSVQYHIDICNLLQHEIEGKYFVAAKLDTGNQLMEMLAFDFCSGYMRQGRCILSEQELLGNRKAVTQDGVTFSVCSDDVAFLYYLIKKVEKKSINKIQFSYLLALWKSDRANILVLLQKHFSSQAVNELSEFFDKADYSRFDGQFFNRLHHETKRIYTISLKNRLLEFGRKLNRFMKPTGMIIGVFGCDGAGKSTVIDDLVLRSKEIEAFRSDYYHHLFAAKGSSLGQAIVNRPHSQKPRSLIMSDLKLLYFFYKYTLGYWLIAYPQKVRSGLVIFDRYYHDILVDPKRYRHNGSKWLTILIGKLIPKPDLFFVIDASVELIQKRKQEVSYNESARQRMAYHQLKASLSNLYVIDNSTDVNKASFEVRKFIYAELVKRYKARYFK